MAREQKILIQVGQCGEPAPSATCSTSPVNPAKHRLLFERFSAMTQRVRTNPSWPDIDLDLPSGDRRESGSRKSTGARRARRGDDGKRHTYRGRSIVREVASSA